MSYTYAPMDTRSEDYQYNLKLIREYRLTRKNYDELYDFQGGLCAICERPAPRFGKTRLAVDHCHSSGETRGLLCNSCNARVGVLENHSFRMAVEAYLLSPPITRAPLSHRPMKVRRGNRKWDARARSPHRSEGSTDKPDLISARVTPAQRDALLELGKGNVSQGVHSAVEMASAILGLAV